MKQTELILNHLERYGSITPAEAINEYGCYRLGARIWDLRHMGHPIVGTMEHTTNRFNQPTRYMRYHMNRSEKHV